MSPDASSCSSVRTRGLVLAAAHLHLGERHERRRAFLGRGFLGAREPLLAPLHGVLQIGRARGDEVVRSRDVRIADACAS